MVERIRLLLEVRQLSPTQFADAIGIARPIVSHILSGRNKPSLEVVQRILGAMPDLSMAWLLNGTGPMLATGAAVSVPNATPEPLPQPIEPVKAPAVASISSPSPAGSSAAKSVKSRQHSFKAVSEPFSGSLPAPKRFTPKPSVQEMGNKAAVPAIEPASAPETVPTTAPVPLPIPSVATEPSSATQTNPVAQLITDSDKPIRRIVIFYRDGSFADFQPE